MTATAKRSHFFDYPNGEWTRVKSNKIDETNFPGHLQMGRDNSKGWAANAHFVTIKWAEGDVANKEQMRDVINHVLKVMDAEGEQYVCSAKKYVDTPEIIIVINRGHPEAEYIDHPYDHFGPRGNPGPLADRLEWLDEQHGWGKFWIPSEEVAKGVTPCDIPQLTQTQRDLAKALRWLDSEPEKVFNHMSNYGSIKKFNDIPTPLRIVVKDCWLKRMRGAHGEETCKEIVANPTKTFRWDGVEPYVNTAYFHVVTWDLEEQQSLLQRELQVVNHQLKAAKEMQKKGPKMKFSMER